MPLIENTFAALNLRPEVLQAIEAAGYATPTPVQQQTIPHVLAGRDLFGQAVTGSGKTAAFACPLLSMLDLQHKQPQVLILTPTRELALQITDAVKTYGAHLRGLRVLTVYGGQSYEPQLRELKRGVHVVVGTPGRVMDHLRRETLSMHALSCLVLDEADEMLRMGFIEDVEWILSKTPEDRQTLLFSATLPEPIKRIANRHLKSPEEVKVQSRSITADSIRQRYVLTSQGDKVDTLARIVESETTDGVLVFVRTRTQTVEVAGQLVKAGYKAAALSGEMAQAMRERTVGQFRNKGLHILVATDVAARGLDVDRISHVINYDVPGDFEVYVHRIGRTGRAGRSGQAILFVTPREKRIVYRIEQETRQRLEEMQKPSVATINAKRVAQFKQRIIDTAPHASPFYAEMIAEVRKESGLEPDQIAAALAIIAQGDTPLLLKAHGRSEQRPDKSTNYDKSRRPERAAPARSADAARTETPYRAARSDRPDQHERPDRPDRSDRPMRPVKVSSMQSYRIEVGEMHDVNPKNIVGAIANESGLSSGNIGNIRINADHSIVDLPENLPPEFFKSMDGVWICGQKIQLAVAKSAHAVRRPRPIHDKAPEKRAQPSARDSFPAKPSKPNDKPKEKVKDKDKTKDKIRVKAKQDPKSKGKPRTKTKSKTKPSRKQRAASTAAAAA